MFRNYFKTALRNFSKNKLYSSINIIGLSTGMAVAIVISLWIHDELSFNKNFEHYDRIAQVYQNLDNNGERVTWTNLPYPLSAELRQNYGSDFKRIVMAADWNDHILTIGDKKLKQTGGFFEKEMPDMFSLHIVRGDRRALNDPSSILISESAAKAYFDNDNPINKFIKVDQLPLLKVAGVYQDFPRRSDFANLKFIASWDFLYNNSEGIKNTEDPWRPNFTTLFVELNENANIEAVNARIKDAKLKKLNAHLQKKKPALFLHPMSKWHLYSEFKNGVNTGGAIQYVWMFGIIGLFILLLACINFMNLSTARSEKRAKEVGIRKAIGSLRKQLIIQFFSESLVTVVFAFALSILLVNLFLPVFNSIAEKEMSITWISPIFWSACLAFMFFTALIAGSYPALYLSSFKPVQVLKGPFKAGRNAALPRKVLVVMQFTVCVTLIIGTIIVYRQLQFAKNRPVGYSRANLVNIFSFNSNIHDHFEAVKNELMKTGTVASVAESQSPTTGVWNSTSGLSWPGKDANLSTDFGVIQTSSEYGKTIGWKLKEGRGFSKDFGADSSNLVLNEAAVRYMGLKDPVGTKVTWWDQPYTIIGVIENMVMESPYAEPRPLIYGLTNDGNNMVILRLKPSASASDALSKIEAIFQKFNPDQPFEYKFVDDDYAAKFQNEERAGKLAKIFAVLAVIISCLGLFGLTSFVAEQRKKEIGVRRVLGASVFNVWNILSKEFVILIIVSFLISVPLSYYFMHGWLQHYSYHTDISWWIFMAAGIGSLLITLMVISIQIIKAAMANPVKTLRTE